MKISVIIPTYNRKYYLKNLITFLSKDNNIFEIIVIDDQSTDGTKDMISIEFPEIMYLKGEGLGQKYAKQKGLRAAVGNIITFLDDDALPENGWLEPVIEAFKEGEQVVQCKLIFKNKGECNIKKERANIGTIRWNMRQKGLWNWGIKPRYINLCHEFGIFIKRNVLEKVPFFDPYLAGDGYGESISFSLRLKQAGYCILFIPESIIYHLGANEGGSIDRYKKARNKVCTSFFEILVGNLIYLNKRFRIKTLPFSIIYYILAGCYFSILNRKNCLKYALQGIKNGLAVKIKKENLED